MFCYFCFALGSIPFISIIGSKLITSVAEVETWFTLWFSLIVTIISADLYVQKTFCKVLFSENVLEKFQSDRRRRKEGKTMNENYEISSIGEKIIIISPEGPLQLYK